MTVAFTADAFARESQTIEELIWDALRIAPHARVLFCGYGADAPYVERAVAGGADVWVVEHRDDAIRAFAHLPVTLVRGSTSVIPAAPNAYDVAVAFHYLHETDPTFHTQIIFELARVARRVVIVEPAPPDDPLGKRIAALYGQAKRNLGQFETYQPLDYWKNLLRSAKADVVQQVFAFSKVPPRAYVADTIALLLATMKAEQIPATYLEEMREIARHPGALLLPPARYVVSGAAVGDMPKVPYAQPLASSLHDTKTDALLPVAVAPAAIASRENDTAAQPQSPPEISAAAGYEFPPVDAPPAQRSDAASPSFGEVPFGDAPLGPADDSASAPFGTPFAVPPADGWQWEPPNSSGASD